MGEESWRGGAGFLEACIIMGELLLTPESQSIIPSQYLFRAVFF